jgi:hypothetical protein
MRRWLRGPRESRRARQLRKQIDTIGFCPLTPGFLHDFHEETACSAEGGTVTALACGNCGEERYL